LVALERLQFRFSGGCSVGETSPERPSQAKNLAFDGEDPIIEMGGQGRRVEVLLDTGDQVTEFFRPSQSSLEN